MPEWKTRLFPCLLTPKPTDGAAGSTSDGDTTENSRPSRKNDNTVSENSNLRDDNIEMTT